MHLDLAASLQAAASWLQSAAMVVPISQLSVISWVIFAASGSLDPRVPVQRS